MSQQKIGPKYSRGTLLCAKQKCCGMIKGSPLNTLKDFSKGDIVQVLESVGTPTSIVQIPSPLELLAQHVSVEDQETTYYIRTEDWVPLEG